MKSILLFILLGLLSGAASAETRCGWLQNPSPANWWLVDKDGEWILSQQGRYFLSDESWDNMPKIRERDKVRTNRSYGYSCACLKVKTDKAAKRILQVYSGKSLPLKKCKADPALKTPQ